MYKISMPQGESSVVKIPRKGHVDDLVQEARCALHAPTLAKYAQQTQQFAYIPAYESFACNSSDNLLKAARFQSICMC